MTIEINYTEEPEDLTPTIRKEVLALTNLHKKQLLIIKDLNNNHKAQLKAINNIEVKVSYINAHAMATWQALTIARKEYQRKIGEEEE